MRVLNLNDDSVRNLRRFHPALRSAKVIASGVFATVFDDGDPDTVLKLTTCCYSYAFLTDGCSPGKAHTPRIFEDFDCVGETSKSDPMYLVRMERLYPLAVGSDSRKFARKVANLVKRKARFSADDLDDLEMPASLRKVFYQMEWFFINIGGTQDFENISNTMSRKDGTIVLSDPVFNQERMVAVNTERREERREERRKERERAEYARY